MMRKTVSILMTFIAVLLVSLAVIILIRLNSPGIRVARAYRNVALKTLLSRKSPDSSDTMMNLHYIATNLREPFGKGGSLDNLNHFLSKDPGRRDFPRNRDYRRSVEYLGGAVGIRADRYAEEVKSFMNSRGVPEWGPGYLGKARALFDEVRTDVLIITGIPEKLTLLSLPDSEEKSITQKTEEAVGYFALKWIPKGEKKSRYSVNRKIIRNFLLSNKRFKRRMKGLDNAWRELAASMYNLSVNPRWKIVVQYYPELDMELSELTTIVLAADIHRRAEDLMLLVSDSVGPGIMWLPDFSYYKNIPELTGQLESAKNEDITIFFVKVNLGYSFRDRRTQTWLNRRKDWLTDYFNLFLSEKEFDVFSSRDYPQWRSALLKAEGLYEINKKMVLSLPFGKRKNFGVRDLAFVKVNLLASP